MLLLTFPELDQMVYEKSQLPGAAKHLLAFSQEFALDFLLPLTLQEKEIKPLYKISGWNVDFYVNATWISM